MTRLVCALLLGVAWAAAASDELVLPPIHRMVLPNGMRVLIGESHELPLVQMSLLLDVGASTEPAEAAGLASLTADALMRGAGPYDAPTLAREIDSIGGQINAGAGNDATQVGAEFLAEDFERGLELLQMVVREPRFATDEVRRARDEQQAAIAGVMENPRSVVERCFAAALYRDHSYGRSVLGTRASLASLDAADVRRFHAERYRPDGAILTVVGDVDAARAEELVRATFGDWRACERASRTGVRGLVGRLVGAGACAAAPPLPAAPAPVVGRRVTIVDKPDATQTQIRIGSTGMARRDPELLTASVANTVLGGGFSSILIEELRIKRSLTYSAYSGFAARLLGGDFRLGTFTKTETTAETTQLAIEVLERYRREGPSTAALAKAKAYVRGQFPLRMETVDAVAGRLAENEFYGVPADDLETYRGRVAAVTPATARAAATAHMPVSENLEIVVLGPAASIRESLEAALGPVAVVPAAACEDAPAALGD